MPAAEPEWAAGALVAWPGHNCQCLVNPPANGEARLGAIGPRLGLVNNLPGPGPRGAAPGPPCSVAALRPQAAAGTDSEPQLGY